MTSEPTSSPALGSWDFFKCTLCSYVISPSGTGRSTSTCGMINHLKLKHKEQLPENTSTSVSASEQSSDTLPITSRARFNIPETGLIHKVHNNI